MPLSPETPAIQPHTGKHSRSDIRPRVDSAPGRSLSFALCHETATIVIPNGQVFTVGRVDSAPYRRVGSQLLQSETTLQPSGGYLLWRQLHAQSYGGTYIWISLQYTAHFQVPHTTKRHRRIDKQSRCLNGSCSAVAGYVETSKFSRWLQMPSHGEIGSQPRSLDVTVVPKDNYARKPLSLHSPTSRLSPAGLGLFIRFLQ